MLCMHFYTVSNCNHCIASGVAQRLSPNVVNHSGILLAPRAISQVWVRGMQLRISGTEAPLFKERIMLVLSRKIDDEIIIDEKSKQSLKLTMNPKPRFGLSDFRPILLSEIALRKSLSRSIV